MYTSTDSCLLYKVRACGERHSHDFVMAFLVLIARELIRLRKKFGVGRNRSESSMSDIFGAIQVTIVARVGV